MLKSKKVSLWGYNVGMIRTRDFLLFALALVFILYGIAGTVWFDLRENNEQSPELVDFKPGQTLTGAVIASTDEYDREENIARLRNKLAAGEGEIEAGPPVFSSVDETPSSTDLVGIQSPQYCSVPSQNPNLVALWPAGEVKMKEVEGARIYLATITTEVGTSTETSEQVLLQLSALPIIAQSPNCLPGEVIGVSIDGDLIINDQSASQTAYPTGLIGYALDGFPIYKAVNDDIQTDACGGLMTDSGYRYYSGASSDFVLGCFVGTPSQFNL